MVKLDEYVKIAEAAEMLGASQHTLRNSWEAGKIRVRRNPANGYRLFRRSDLKKCLASAAAPVEGTQ
jgi:DNA-binding transcriptional MerR regulator